MLDGIVDVYLPDFKYMDSRLSQQYSYAADYTETAKKALEEMIRQTGKPVFFTAEDELVKEGYVEEQIMKERCHSKTSSSACVCERLQGCNQVPV